jgi:ribosomal protein S18 acetylase RimI-like enzyme
MSEPTWRAAELTDIDEITGLFEAIEKTAPIGMETAAGDVQDRLSASRLDLRADTLVGVDTAGALCAYAEAADMGIGAGQFRVRLTCALRPELDSDSMRFALRWLTGRAQSMRHERHPDLPGVCAVRCAAVDQAKLDAFTAAGFEVDHWHRDMIRDITLPAPATEPPDGVAVLIYDPKYSEATRLAQNDAYADDSHALLLSAEDWPRHVTGRADFSPSTSFLALDGPEVVAFLCSTAGDGEGIVHILGTRPPWRGRGLGASLISRALTAYQQAGLTTARVQVCSSNTRAVGLYTKLGFSPSGPGYALLFGQVALPRSSRPRRITRQIRRLSLRNRPEWPVTWWPNRQFCPSGLLTNRHRGVTISSPLEPKDGRSLRCETVLADMAHHADAETAADAAVTGKTPGRAAGGDPRPLCQLAIKTDGTYLA